MCPLSSSVHRQDTVTLAGVWADQSTVEDGGGASLLPRSREGTALGWRQMLEMKRKKKGDGKYLLNSDYRPGRCTQCLCYTLLEPLFVRQPLHFAD